MTTQRQQLGLDGRVALVTGGRRGIGAASTYLTNRTVSLDGGIHPH